MSAVPGPPRDLVGYGPSRPRVVWPNGAAVALSIVVNYEEGSEASKPDGDTRNEGMTEVSYAMPDEFRDLAVESMYEYGSRAGIWRLLRMFEEYGIHMTFFACAVALQKNPEVGAAIREYGHEPCSHGYRWSEPWHFTRDEEKEQIRLAVEAIRETTGSRPVGWYWRYSSTPWTRDLLVEEGGFTYDSETYNDDLPYFTEVQGKRHLVVPYSQTYNDVRFILSEGTFGAPNQFADLLKRALDELHREGERGYPKMM
jgi:peptidoglycan/xylan/chitin deacetylase (PgdA/CDA1 family)